MKINRLEAHDRLQHLKQDQSVNIFQGAEDCLKKNPLSLALQERSPYVYIFAHPRTHDDGVTKVMYWQPRLTRPEAQTNSYLFRALSHTDIVDVIWILPPEEMWKQYEMGNVVESEVVLTSIINFKRFKKRLEMSHKDDLPDEKVQRIYKDIKREKTAPKFEMI